MAARTNFTTAEARRVGGQIGIDWESAPFDVEQFRSGMEVELEHRLHDPLTNVTGDDPRDWEDRPRSSERVPRLLRPARTDGTGGETRAPRVTSLQRLEGGSVSRGRPS